MDYFELLIKNIDSLDKIKFALKVLKWKEKLEFKVTKDNRHWCVQYKGISFNTYKECELFCFVCWCRDADFTVFEVQK